MTEDIVQQATETVIPIETKKPESLSTEPELGRTEIRVRGRSTWVPSAHIDGRTVVVTGKWLKLAEIRDEDLVEGDTLTAPQSFVRRLAESGLKADIFTFSQKLPGTIPLYEYHLHWENVAVIPISTFSDWWDRRVDPGVRRAVRKATKSGVVVMSHLLDDAFVKGIVSINNESPVRQGRPFWHYQKSFEAVKEENSTYSERTTFLGAHFEGELIAFMRITFADRIANIVQLLSMMKHYDKRPANALIAKAVEICEQRGATHLMYYSYIYNDPKSSLTEFKRRNGFEKVMLPRYYIPLTIKGRTALSLSLHRGPKHYIPQPLLTELLRLRNRWYERRAKSKEGNS
ncbi:MAG: hypothetical protein WAL75_06435 [Terracidiphilus sp.]